MSNIVFTVINDVSYDRRMHRICKSLASNGYNVTLIGRKLKSSIAMQPVKYEAKRLTCIWNDGKLFYLEYNIRLFFVLLFTKADIYAAVDVDTIIPNFMVAMLKGKRKAYDAHEYFSEVPEVVSRPFVKKIWEWVENTFIPMADIATTVSDSLADIFCKKYGILFQTIRNVPYLDERVVPNEGEYLLYQGALNKGRGLKQLIEAMNEIGMPLKIAGEGDLSEELRKKVKEGGLQDKIEFLGFVPPGELDEITANAYVGLNLLEKDGLSYYYSLANKFFDYMHHGVPSINMNFPEYQKINDEHNVCILIDSVTSDNIVKAVNKLVTDKEFYGQLKANSMEARKTYNWQKEEDKLLNLYQKFGK